MADWRVDRISSAHRGENPMVMAKLRSGLAVIGETRHLPGYSLLLCDDHLTDLGWPMRAEFLFDLSLVGEAVQSVCRDKGLRRINYEVLGNSMDWPHGHVHPGMTGSRRNESAAPSGAIRAPSEAPLSTVTATRSTVGCELRSRSNSAGS